MIFFEDLYFISFCDEINFETRKNLLKITNKEAIYRIAIHMKYSCKFWNKRIIQKKLAFSSFQ
jgi:hypothetical protein